MAEFTPDAGQQVVLQTWHGGDDLRNPAMQLFLETAEIGKLLHKAAYKPGHVNTQPALMDEEGDAYYYAQLLAAMMGMTMADLRGTHRNGTNGFMADTIAWAGRRTTFNILNNMAAVALDIWSGIEYQRGEFGDAGYVTNLRMWLVCFCALLAIHGHDLNEVVAQNQAKLAGGTNHGWRDVTVS